jgi:NB-ARC domain
VTPEEFLADVAVVYTGDATRGAFGSGRLIAPGLVLTAGHVGDYPTRQEPMHTGWKVRVVRERAPSGAWVGPSHQAELVWRGSGNVDIALLQITGDTVLTPKVMPVFAFYDAIGSIDNVDAAGFPQAWFAGTDTVRDYTVRGSLRVATQYEPYAPYAWSVPSADKPDDPHGWKGMSGAAVCKVGPDQKLYLFGTVQEVPANFSGGLLEVAQLSAAFADDDFCNALRVSLGLEPRIISWIGSISARVLVPGVQAPTEYVDRPELTQPLLTHLLDGQAVTGHAIISAVYGLGGIGKTTIARWLVWRPEIERRFPDGRIWITLGNEPPDALTIINDCVSQLDPALKAKATVEAARADLATLLRDRSILFVVDDVWPGRSADIAKALLVPSSHCRFLLTTRFSRLADDPAIGAMDFPLDEMSVDQAKELITHVLGREPSLEEEPLVERLCETVGGHPLALELAAARIREGRSWNTLLTDLSAEIARLDVLEEGNDDLIEVPVTDKVKDRQRSVRASLLLSVRSLRREGQQLFAWLGAISEDATITPRMAATLWSIEEETALRHLRSLSGAGILEAADGVYRMHDLMHDLARELLTAPVIAGAERDIPGLGLTLQDASRQLLERYRAKTSNGLWHTLLEDGYIHDRLIQHFEWANWDSELERLLWEESTDGHCGWYWARERLGQMSGFIADLNRVWSHADRIVATAATDNDRALAIALQLHCGLIIASINSLSARIPIEVLVGAVRCGLIAFPTALAFARQHPDARLRVSVLLSLASEVPSEAQPSVLGEALRVARDIDDARTRARALAEVVQRLPAEEALRVARSIDEARVRAYSMAEVAGRLPAEEALVVARGIDRRGARAQALAAVAQQLPVEEALVVVRSIDDAAVRAQALAAVAQRLPAEEALVVARGIDDARERAYSMAEVAGRLPAEEALVVAGSIDRKGARAQALAAVAQRLPVEEALVVVRSIDDAAARAQALAAVAQRLPAEEALVVARGIDDARVRAYSMAEVARRLPAEEASVVTRDIYGQWAPTEGLAAGAQLLATEQQPLGEASSAARGIDNARWYALAAFAKHLPPEEQEAQLAMALRFARRIGDARVRARELAEVAQRLPVEQRPSVLGEALNVARGIDDTWVRSRTLAAIAQLLPPEQQPSVLGEALSVARGIDDTRARAQALAAVAHRLPADEALMLARSIDHIGARAQVLAEVVQLLPVEQRPSLLGEALRAARGIDDGRARAQALTAVAQWLPAEQQRGVLGEALSAARRVDDAGARAQALAAVAQRLPAEEALVIVRNIDDAAARSQALAAVAQRLPAEEALVVARGIDRRGARAQALAAVAHRLPAEKALVVARGIDRAGARAQVLAAVAQLLPAERHASVLGEALSVARGVDDARARAHALAAVAQRLPAGEALAVARSIDDAAVRTQALTAVAQRLPEEEALVVVRSIDDAAVRAQALTAVAQRLPAEEALVMVRSIDGAAARARALTAVAQRLPAEQQPSVLGEALSAARDVDDAGVRAHALAAVAQLLPAEQQPSVLDEALSAACRINHTGTRIQALREVAQRLGRAQITNFLLHQWIDTVRVLAIRERRACVSDFAAILPIIDAIGSTTTIRILGRSIVSVGLWWPRLPAGPPASLPTS